MSGRERRSVLIALVAFASTVSSHLIADQTPRDAGSGERGSGSISGRVIAADGTTAPIRRAQVTLQGVGRTIARTTVSDDDGRWAFTGLPAGRYLIEARKAAYLRAALGARRRGGAAGVAVTLAEGQQIVDRLFAMARGAVVTGTVRLENGSPAVGITVSVFYLTLRGDREVLSRPTIPASATTDDEGVYRIYGLSPGEAVVLARPREIVDEGRERDFIQLAPGDVLRATEYARALSSAGPLVPPPTTVGAGTRPAVVSYAPVFHPGATELTDAGRVRLAPDAEYRSIDISLRLVPTAMVRGVVTGPDGAPMSGVQVRIAGSTDFGTLGGAASDVIAMTTASNGRFQSDFLIPGQYVVTALARSFTPTAVWAMQEIAVAGRDVELSLQLQPSVVISGRVVTDSAFSAPDLTRVAMRLVPVGNTEIVVGGSTAIAPDGSFQMPVLPGRYRLSINQSQATGWMPLSSIVRGQDTLDFAYDVRAGETISDWVVTITDRPSELAGAITDAGGQPATDYFIVVFAADRAFWTPPSRRVVYTRTDGDGNYVIKGLPAGEYRIAALTDLEPGESIAPSFLESLVAASVPIKIANRQQTTQNLRIGSR